MLLAGSAFAAEPGGDAQAREKLRTVSLRLRDVETERDTLKTARDTLAEENKKLADQLAALQKQTVADGVTLNKLKTELGNKLSEREESIADLQTELKTERERLAQSQALAEERETARLRLVEAKQVVENTLAARETQNIELYRTANEILGRYERFGFGEAIAAKEPFVGLTRTKLENLVQGYRDALLKQRAQAKL
ncbi:MAG: phage major capsid protein [Opitutaceae bacterium]|nr:phage major capsid protein [Opitutaceae bacterium]